MPLRACLLALGLLVVGGAAPVSADDGRPSRTVVRPTDLPRDGRALARSVSAPTKELVLLVGGLGSSASDATWDTLIARLWGDPRYEIRRFGALPDYPYDTFGSLDANARSLTDEIRALAPRYTGVHLVTHSMGGNVADRAIAQGLSAADGLRTYVALAAPHSGSDAARVGELALAMVGPDAPELRALAESIGGPAATSAAARDVARTGPAGVPSGVTRVDVRLATDALVTARDARDPGVEARTLLPAVSLEGHGGILRDPQALELTLATIARRAPPRDERSQLLRAAADVVSLGTDVVVGIALLAGLLAATVLAWQRRRRRGVPWFQLGPVPL